MLAASTVLLSLLACTSKDGVLDTGVPVGDTGCTPVLWTLDLDGDGWAGDATRMQCDAPAEYSEALGDCNDDDVSVHPDAEEVCDGVDNDCDGVIDPPDQTWYTDADGDGYGDPDSAVEDCAQPVDAVSDATDCDDGRADAWPGADEVWYDGIDQDCAGGDDFDADGDGEQSDAYGGVDCQDWNATVGTFAEEVCGDYIDEDCDGVAEACSLGPLLTIDEADFVLDGEYSHNYYGLSLTIGQDLTSRGDALVVASIDHGYDDGDEVHVYSYAGGVLSRVATITATEELAALGYVIHDDGDYSGDGVPDLALNQNEAVAYGYDGPGQVFVFSAPLSGTLSVDDADLRIEGTVNNSWWGQGLSTSMDWGRGSLVVAVGGSGWDYSLDTGTVEQGGRVSVLETDSTTVSVDDDVARIECGYENCGLGDVVLAADVDGDGVDDLLTRARYLGDVGDPGMLGVLFGPFDGTVDIEDADGGLVSVRDDRVGRELESVGDIDADGVTDFLVPAVGCELYDERGGCLYLYSGAELADLAETGEAASATLAGFGEDTEVGFTISHGDINGDGALDVLSAYHESDEYADLAGRAWLWYGPLSGTQTTGDADVQIQGAEEDVFLGWDLSATGDLDGDGCDDIAASEVLWDSAEYEDAGRVGVWLGPCL